jgi:hypothetical protein
VTTLWPKCVLCYALHTQTFDPSFVHWRLRMVVEFTTTCGIVAYHHVSYEFKLHSWRGVLDKTVCDKVCQWLATGLWISLSTPTANIYWRNSSLFSTTHPIFLHSWRHYDPNVFYVMHYIHKLLIHHFVHWRLGV